MVITLKNRHIERLKRGECTTATGMAFVEALTNLERVADQCSNVALLILGEKYKEIMGNHHAYVRELHKGGDPIYNEELSREKNSSWWDCRENLCESVGACEMARGLCA